MSIELEELPTENLQPVVADPVVVPLPTKSVDDIVDPKSDKKDKKKPGFWDKVFRKKKLLKPNVVAAIYLRNNGRAEPMELEAKKGFFTVYGKTYAEDKDCTFVLGKDRIPFIIIKENELVPEGRKRWYEKELKTKFFEMTDHALKAIRNAEIVRRDGEKSDFKFNMKAAIVLGIMALVGGAVLFSYI